MRAPVSPIGSLGRLDLKIVPRPCDRLCVLCWWIDGRNTGQQAIGRPLNDTLPSPYHSIQSESAQHGGFPFNLLINPINAIESAQSSGVSLIDADPCELMLPPCSWMELSQKNFTLFPRHTRTLTQP